MKKISTTMGKQLKNVHSQKLTIGLDLADRSSWYCVLDENGQVVLEQRVGTTAKAIEEVLGGMPRSRVALETGTHSPWVSRLLSKLGHEVIVAHPRKVRLIGESRRKDDPAGCPDTGAVSQDRRSQWISPQSPSLSLGVKA